MAYKNEIDPKNPEAIRKRAIAQRLMEFISALGLERFVQNVRKAAQKATQLGQDEKVGSGGFVSYSHEDSLNTVPVLKPSLSILEDLIQRTTLKLAQITNNIRAKAVAAVENAVAEGKMNEVTGEAVAKAVQEVYTETAFEKAVQLSLRPRFQRLSKEVLDKINNETLRELVKEKYQHYRDAHTNKTLTSEERLTHSVNYVTVSDLVHSLRGAVHQPMFNAGQVRTFCLGDMLALNQAWIAGKRAVLVEAFQQHSELRTANQFQAFAVVCEPSRNAVRVEEADALLTTTNYFASGQ